MGRGEAPCAPEARREATQSALAGSRGEAPGEILRFSETINSEMQCKCGISAGKFSTFLTKKVVFFGGKKFLLGRRRRVAKQHKVR